MLGPIDVDDDPMRRLTAVVFVLGLVLGSCTSGERRSTGEAGGLLDEVGARGELMCGVSGTTVGFSEQQPDGSYVGFDVDYCRAVAAAVLGDADAVVFVPLASSERFGAVRSGQVDVLFRNTTVTQSRDTAEGVDFGPVIFYDGQQFMARAADGYTESSTVVNLAGAVVCVNAGSTTELNLADAAANAGVQVTVRSLEGRDLVAEDFISGACDVMTSDGSGLVGRRSTQQPEGQRWVIFPSTPISKEPLAPAYSHGDPQFGDVIDWVVYATIIADEKGINRANVESAAADPPDVEVARLLGLEGELQTAMGLAPDALYQVISQVGNYSDIFDRHLAPVGLSRQGTVNASWLDGGLIYAPPAR